MDAFRVTLGPTKVMQYVLQGMFHPARRVRETYSFSPCFGSFRVGSFRLEALLGTGSDVCSSSH